MITEQNRALLSSDEATIALRANPIFGGATDEEIAGLAQLCRVEAVAAGANVLKEGEVADDLYLLLGGGLLVYTHDDLGRVVALARISDVNEIVGEQAFLGGEGKRRSASVRAMADARLLRIPGEAFRELLQRDHALGQRLRDLGASEIRNKVSQQMPLLRHLATTTEGASGLREEAFPTDAVVCRQGEPGREFYVILSGSVRVFRTEPDGSIVQLARLQAGQSFGELSLIEGTPRSATVVADGELRVLAIGIEDFRRVYDADEHVRGHFAGLSNIYSYRGAGVALQFAGELFDRPAVGTLYRLDEGRSIITHRIVGQDIWSIQQTDAPADLVQHSYVDLARGIDRTLLMSGDMVVGVVVSGAWKGIGQLHGLVLERIPLSPAEVEAFRHTGELVETAAPIGDPIVCRCMRITQHAILRARQSGCQTVRTLSARTGAGTVCGGCLPRLGEITAETLSHAVRCLEVIDRASQVKSFRFEVPDRHRDAAARPGQRIVVQTLIGGAAVARPYTLTSSVTERGYYEITVQREPHGVMSNWLFDHLGPGATVEILPPSGTCFFELAEPRPLVCLVGGIGITPALGICRSVAASGAPRRIHVDCSVSAREEIVCGEELSELAARHPTLTCRTRVTREEGRFQPTDLATLTTEFPNSDWLICGSKPFNAAAQRHLLDLGVPAHHLHVEAFDAVGSAMPDDPAVTPWLSPRQRTLVSYGLLVAVGAFVVQALLGITWPWLDRRQAGTAYRALTGGGLLVLLALQWHLGYVRMRDRAQAMSRAYAFHIAIGPAVLGLLWLHSTHFGYALSLAVSASFLVSLAVGAILGVPSSSPRWERARSILLGGHIVLSCVATALALAHGFTALWY